MSDLYHLIYFSSAKNSVQPEELLTLLEKVRPRNAERGITGILLYVEGSFFQVLEGAPEVILALFEKIEKDPRHSRVSKLIFEPIEERDFADWSMGFATATFAELQQIAEINDFFTEDCTCMTCLSEGRVKKLLKGFKEGSWRNPIYEQYLIH